MHAAATSSHLLPGFDDYGTEANAVFRACLAALSRPASLQPLQVALEAPSPLSPLAAAVMLTLADYETTFWLDEPLAAAPAVDEFLRFHTGARRTDAPAAADFAVIADVPAMPPLARFKQGTAEYPDRSTTLVLQVSELSAGAGMTFAGPGIKDRVSFSASLLPAGFIAQLQANRAVFPCGVDLIFAGAGQLAALPRSVNLVSGD